MDLKQAAQRPIARLSVSWIARRTGIHEATDTRKAEKPFNLLKVFPSPGSNHVVSRLNDAAHRTHERKVFTRNALFFERSMKLVEGHSFHAATPANSRRSRAGVIRPRAGNACATSSAPPPLALLRLIVR